MKTAAVLLASVLLLPALHAQNADTPKTEKPAANAAPRRAFARLVSPEIHPDRTVTFRLAAPNAREVRVTGGWGGDTVALTNGGSGVWSATVGPLEPNIYDYSFSVDGLAICDPANSWVKPMRSPCWSAVEVPGDPPRVWEIQPVPHGTVHEHFYFSRSLGVKRRVHVYTPPGYEKKSGKYPVLYLLHGMGDNDATWSASGRANFIADNLLAQHQIKPIIVVMTDGHAVDPAAGRDMVSRNLEAFSSDLLRDVIPLVESTYRVKANRENRAIIGLSMGGGQSLTIGLEHRDLFAWVGGMSSYLSDAQALVAKAFPEPKSDLKLLWFACGRDDGLVEHSRRLSAALKEKHIPHVFKETAGNHSWPVWRGYLGEFLPLLFVSAK
jgi:enterochelin esterase family protein